MALDAALSASAAGLRSALGVLAGCKGARTLFEHVYGSKSCITLASSPNSQRHLGIYIIFPMPNSALPRDAAPCSSEAPTTSLTVAKAAGAVLVRLCCGFPRRGVTVAAPCAAPCSSCCACGCAASFSAPRATRRRLLVPERVGELISVCVASCSALSGSAVL